MVMENYFSKSKVAFLKASSKKTKSLALPSKED